jgi:hypothetical protein
MGVVMFIAGQLLDKNLEEINKLMEWYYEAH